MNSEEPPRVGYRWLEWLLVLSVFCLVVQVLPQNLMARFGQFVLLMVDPRNWPRTAWFVANLLIVLVLLAVRFGPGLLQDWREQRERRDTQRQQHIKQQELKEQRQNLEKLQQAKRRRIY